MRSILTTLILFTIFSLSAQSILPNIRTETGLGVMVIHSEIEPTDGILMKGSLKTRSTGILGTSIEQSLLIPIDKKLYLSLGVGLNYYHYNIQLNKKLLFFSEKLGVTTLVAEDDKIFLSKSEYQSKYFSIPVSARFIISDQPKCQLYLQAGVNNLFLRKSENSLEATKLISTSTFFSRSEPFDLKNHPSNKSIQSYFDKKVNSFALDIWIAFGNSVKLNDKSRLSMVIGFQRGLKEIHQFFSESKGLKLELRLQYELN